MNEQHINLNIRYDLPDTIWEQIPTIYQQLPGWIGFGKGGKLGELHIPYWFNFDTAKKHLTASVEPSGLSIFGKMEDTEFEAWLAKLKLLATQTLGFKVGEIETGEVGHDIEWLKDQSNDLL